MAGPNRHPTDAVERLRGLEREPYRHHFFEALRRVECAYPESPRLGRAARPAAEPVRVGQEASLAFASGTLASFTPPEEASRAARLQVFFLGLFGPNGPLPLHLTEHARNRQRNHADPTFASFADLFHHRMLSFFYRAWADAQPTVEFDRPDSDRFAQYLGALLGIGQEPLRNRDAVPDLAKLHQTALLSNHTHSAEGLQGMLQDYFEMPVRIEQFVGQWIELPESARWQLGDSPETGALGLTTVAGSRVWDCQQKFRIVFGPLDLPDYQRLLPGSDSLRRLVALVRSYTGDELGWDVNVILKKEEVPPLQLGQAGQLGLTTWAASCPPEEDPDQLFLNPLETAA